MEPLTLAYALYAISIISSSQLGALNRVGTQALFHLVSGLLTVPAVYLGWKWSGLYGLTLGFLASRIPLVVQDIFLVRLIGAGGWLSLRTWLLLAVQAGIGIAFLLLQKLLVLPFWASVALAAAHAGAVGGWLLWKMRDGGTVVT